MSWTFLLDEEGIWKNHYQGLLIVFLVEKSEIKAVSGFQAEKKITQRKKLLEELSQEGIIGLYSTGGKGFQLIMSSTK